MLICILTDFVKLCSTEHFYRVLIEFIKYIKLLFLCCNYFGVPCGMLIIVKLAQGSVSESSQQNCDCTVESRLNVMSLSKFSVSHIGCWLIIHWQWKDGSVISRQASASNCQFSCGLFYFFLSLYPAAVPPLLLYLPSGSWDSHSASPETAVNASFLFCWLECTWHLQAQASPPSFFNRHQALK